MAPTLEVQPTGVTKLDVDAITNAANSLLENLGGVAAVISAAGGPELEKECRAAAPIGLGDAVATTAGNMHPPIRWVIHASTMLKPGGTTTGAVIDKATRSSLDCAEKLGAKSIGFVAFGTGVGGFPVAEAATLMVRAARDHKGKSLQKIVFSVHGHDAQKAFDDAVAAG
jgi:O-acetyl-ADP-ribose deacetylase (regulator of RNase III)